MRRITHFGNGALALTFAWKSELRASAERGIYTNWKGKRRDGFASQRSYAHGCALMQRNLGGLMDYARRNSRFLLWLAGASLLGLVFAMQCVTVHPTIPSKAKWEHVVG
jgi:hypothetical protein